MSENNIFIILQTLSCSCYIFMFFTYLYEQFERKLKRCTFEIVLHKHVTTRLSTNRVLLKIIGPRFHKFLPFMITQKCAHA